MRSVSPSDSVAAARALDHLPTNLKKSLTVITQLRIKQIKRERAKVALMPFFEAFEHSPRESQGDVTGLNDDHADRLDEWIARDADVSPQLFK